MPKRNNKNSHQRNAKHNQSRFLLRLIKPTFLTRYLLFMLPLAFIVYLGLSYGSFLSVFSAVIAKKETITPCFLNMNDFLTIKALSDQGNNKILDFFIGHMNSVGRVGFLSIYFYSIMIGALIQISVILYLNKTNPHLLRKSKTLSFSQLIPLVIMISLFSLVISVLSDRASKVSKYTTASKDLYVRSLAYQLNVSPEQLTTMSNKEITDKLGMNENLVTQCQLSNNIHFIPNNQKSYIGMN